MSRILLSLTMLGLFAVAVVPAHGDEGTANAVAVSTVAGGQAEATPVNWYYGPRGRPRWYGSYYYSNPGYYSYPRYYYGGYPGYYSYYYPAPAYPYYPGYGAYYRPYRYYGGARWW